MNIKQIALSTLLLILLHQNTILQWLHYDLNLRRSHRRWWVRPINRSKRAQGFQHNLLEEMLNTDHKEFYDLMRMWPEQFNHLVELLRPYLEKRSRRCPLSVATRLSVTLSYLAQGDSVRSKHLEFRIGKSTAHRIIPETCRAIWAALQPTYLPQMKEADWKKVSEGFMETWQFPNCLGAIDGRHMRLQKPIRTGSQDYNYKHFFSMVLMAACDANYKFTWVDIGQYGSVSDGGVWANTEFGMDLENGEVDLPPPTPLPQRTIPFPYVFVADEAFPLKTYLMRPYPRKRGPYTDDERIFNYRLSRARRVIENTFGILTSRWQILHKPLCCSVENAEDIFKALVCLHNFIMTGQEDMSGINKKYCPPDYPDNDDEENGAWRTEGISAHFKRLGRLGANNASSVPYGMRNYLKNYFVSGTGVIQAPWQYERTFHGRNINISQQVWLSWLCVVL